MESGVGLKTVSKFKSLSKYWLVPVIWAGVIYFGSSDTGSAQRSSRLIAPVVRWLVPEISDAALWRIVFAARKGAHVTEYAVFAILVWWALRHSTHPEQRTGWSKRHVSLAWALATLFAMSDELHQKFVPGRQGSPWDVIIDASGAALGLFVVWLIGRWRKVW